MTTNTEFEFFLQVDQMIEQDKHIVPYHMQWRGVTKSISGAVLLRQIFYRWKQHGRKPFYKFKEPCAHRLYRSGDSWTEELNISRAEFDFAIRKIGYKKSRNRQEAHECPVEYWTDAARLTYYTINIENLNKKLQALSPSDTLDMFAERPQLLGVDEVAMLPAVAPEVEIIGDEPEPVEPPRKTPPIHKVRFQRYVTHDSSVTKSEKVALDLNVDPKITTEITSKNISTTTTPPEKRVAEVVTQINLLLQQNEGFERRAPHERMTSEYLALICQLHRLRSPEEVLHAVRALAPNPKIGTVLGVLKGRRNGNQYISSCFNNGKCVLWSPAGGDTPPVPQAPEWHRVLSKMEATVNKASFNTWLKGLLPPRSDNGVIAIPVQDDVFKYWLEAHYTARFEQVYQSFRGRRTPVKFVVDEQLYDLAAEAESDAVEVIHTDD